MEHDMKLYDAEYRLADIVWEHEPMQSGELARLCSDLLGWKRTTTYTVLKKLTNRGILQNQDSFVTSLVKRGQIQHYESRALTEKSFSGSLPRRVVASRFRRLGSAPITPP
jgi:predicted transcriptional regulator